MEETKILVVVSGGNIQSIDSNNKNVKIVIIDEDNAKAGDEDKGIHMAEPDNVCDNMHALYNPEDGKRDAEIHNKLKELNF